jgi:hypothetical protein
LRGPRSLFAKSRRRLLVGLVLLLLGGVSLAYTAPGFARAATEAFNTGEIDPRFPLPARKALEAENKRLWEEFYRRTSLLVLVALVLAGGAYLTLTHLMPRLPRGTPEA